MMTSMLLVCILNGSFVLGQDVKVTIFDASEIIQATLDHVVGHSCFSLLSCKIAQDRGEENRAEDGGFHVGRSRLGDVRDGGCHRE